MKSAILQVVLVFLAVGSAQANAIPIKFTYSGVVIDVNGVAGGLTSFGEVVKIEVIVDNGGSDLISQHWDPVLDTVSATFSTGSYFANFVEDWYASGGGFRTDAVGNLVLSQWYGTGALPPSSSDNFGTGVYLFNVGVNVSFGGSITSSGEFSDVNRWSVAVVDNGNVPVPSTLALIGFGLAGLGWSRRKMA